MFGSTKSSEDAKTTPTAASPSGSINALAKGTTVEGTVKCDTDLRVDGVIKGKLTCKSKIIIGPTGSIEGEITCQNAVIEGRFKGILSVTELLNVRETAEVDGEISTGKLLVQSGARFNVACRMDNGAGNGQAKTLDVKTTTNVSSSVAGAKTEVRN